ncbi:bifunctional apoptosis regulator-like isoform X1 [Pecten maximus]|uniref:bifunctional apoptosis regulator-like isoform X1 n=1 Tax=Pecten maximus TaxID=6579 RepID=UPI0014586421|nr:bifunctional apoptosis regulator-like isoform X1 [Pecten maximus]
MSTEEHGEAKCGCCFELLVEPTTLVCGHTFCRHCLAKWTVTSGRRLCPTCKSEWRGSPKVNIIIRAMLEKSYPQRLEERIKEVDTDKNHRIISTFDSMNSSVTDQETMQLLQNGVQANRDDIENNGQPRWKHFSSGITLGALVICILAYTLNIGPKVQINTPVKEWNTDDVVTWMGQLGTWTDRYSDSIRNNGIDGKRLMMLEDSDVIATLHMTDKLHRKVFLREVAILVTTGTKRPVNFWEYKSMFPFYTLLLLFGFKLSPRITIGYLYLFEYNTVYTRFMMGGFSKSPLYGMEEVDNAFSRMFYTVLLPYRLVGTYAHTWSTVHYFISKYILLVCYMATVHDITWFYLLIRKRFTRTDLRDFLRHYRNAMLWFALSSFLPWFFYEFVFYYNALYLIVDYTRGTYLSWSKLNWI